MNNFRKLLIDDVTKFIGRGVVQIHENKYWLVLDGKYIFQNIRSDGLMCNSNSKIAYRMKKMDKYKGEEYDICRIFSRYSVSGISEA